MIVLMIYVKGQYLSRNRQVCDATIEDIEGL